MTDKGTRIDILSLEDFNATLTARLHEADTLLTTLDTDLHGRSPALGTFVDGQDRSRHYADLYEQYVQRIGRLRAAIVAAQSATNEIINNYTTTEARNHASAADIASKLGGVSAALNDGPATGV